MNKSHEKKIDTKKKSNSNDFVADYGDGPEDEEDDEEATCNMKANTNSQDAAAVEKARRDKIAMVKIKN